MTYGTVAMIAPKAIANYYYCYCYLYRLWIRSSIPRGIDITSTTIGSIILVSTYYYYCCY